MIKFKQLTLDFTRLCNSHCKTCHIWKIKNPVTLELKYIEKLLSQIDKLESIYISGGEPYINPIIYDIAKLVLKYHPKTIWLGATNNIDPKTPYAIKRIRDMGVQVGQVDLSYEGPNHDEWRGTPGNRDKVIRCAKLFKKWGIPYAFASICGEGPDYVPETGDFVFRGEIRNGKRVNTKDDTESVYIKDCPGIKRIICCDPEGGIWPCEDYKPEIFLGNIKEVDLKDMPFERVLEHIAKGKCSPCSMNCWSRRDNYGHRWE